MFLCYYIFSPRILTLKRSVGDLHTNFHLTVLRREYYVKKLSTLYVYPSIKPWLRQGGFGT